MASDDPSNSPMLGCMAMMILLAIIAVALGWATVDSNGQIHDSGVNSNPLAAAQPVGPLPDVGVVGPAKTPAPPPSAAPQVVAPPTSGSAPTEQAPVQQATPAPVPQDTAAPPPPAQCGLPGSIGVTGGNPSGLGGGGGSTTVASTPFVLSTPTLVNCGAHYQLSFSASGNSGTSSGHDCKMEGFDYDISAYVHVGDAVNVTLSLPPNSCG